MLMELAGSFLTQVKELRSAQQVAILHVLMPWIEQTERLATGSSTLSEVREARFSEGLKCPRCQSTAVKRNGTDRDKKGLMKQRYLCHGCGRRFNDLTGTPLAYSKKQDLWGKMARCMVEGQSVRKTAEDLGVHVATAFAWRHKLLDAHRDLEKSPLTGIVETDEMYLLHSLKGSRRVEDTGRKSRRRGGVATKRGLSKEQVCLVVAQDRHQQSLAEISGMGMPSAADVRQVLTQMVQKEAILCTDGAQAYRKYCQETEIQHVPVDGKKRLKGSLYHLNNVNNWHKRFRDWHNVDLRGVATKYLINYTTWFIFLDQARKMSQVPAARQMLVAACSAFGERPAA